MDLLFLDKINTAPIFGDGEFTFEFIQWVSNLVDTLNEVITNIQQALNLLNASRYTSAEINTMFMDGNLPDSVILYDTDLNVYVGKISGVLVKFTTSVYP